jgi:two-component system, NtrC family, nitrogen regulation sensor histidine kinase NtrY
VEQHKNKKPQPLKNFLRQILQKNAIFLLLAGWLFTLAFIVDNYWYSSSSIKYLHRNIQSDLLEQEQDFIKLSSDTAVLRRLSNKEYSYQDLKTCISKSYCFLLYHLDGAGNINVDFWNNQLVEPGIDLLTSKENNRLVTLQNGQYVLIRDSLKLKDERKLLAVALLPVRKEYYVENKNLKREFVHYPQAEKNILISADTTEHKIKNAAGKTLFYLQQKFIAPGENSNWLTLTLNILGLLLLLIVVHNGAHAISEKYGYLSGILCLSGLVVIIRGLTYYLPYLINVKEYGLFDPSIYSSSRVLNSLGDLMVNAFLFCWIVLFIRREVGNKRFVLSEKKTWKWVALLFPLILLVGITFIFADIIKSLIADAKISFNVTNVFTLDEYSFAGFVVLGTLALSYFFLTQVIIQLISPLLPKRKYALFVLVAIIGLILLTFIRNTSFIELNIYVLIWLLAYLWFMQFQLIPPDGFRMAISEVLVWLFIFSSSIAAVIIVENKRIELLQRHRTAEKLSSQADPSTEKIINIAFKYFDNEFLARNFYRFKERISNQELKDSLININFDIYLSKYDTRIYTFDSLPEKPRDLFNDDPVSFDTLNTIWRYNSKETTVPDLRYFEKSYDKYSYICRKTVTDGNTVLGYLFILSDPKRYKNDALIPELFKYQKDYFPEYSNYTYAIYNDVNLVDYSKEYQFSLSLSPEQMPKQETETRKNNGYNEFWYKDNNKIVVIARKDNYGLEAMTLFAWIFSTFLMLLGFFRIITILTRTRLRSSLLKEYLQLNLRSQIHGTFIIITLLSFIVIGIATIFFFINRYERNNLNRLSKAIQIMNNQVQTEIGKNSTFDDMVKFYENRRNDKLEKLARSVAEIHGTDINFYDLNGRLVVSSNPLIYNKGILSNRMNPMAFYQLHNKELVQFINEERMGSVTYQSIYSPVRGDGGKAYAYLNIPSFDSQQELKKEISNFLVTIINLNAFIFLIAGAVALFITNRITSSFTLIADKMRAINLGKDNEEIPWHREDEIGGLVKEYNKMVNKLEASAAQLAKSEREGAWREMARQVAHEIKNPLTPMKLSIQYLQKAIDNNSPNVKEMTSNVARTLVEQIDHLSKIAADFSQFANIGNPRTEVFDLHDLLNSLSSLYMTTEDLAFSWEPVSQRIMLMADKTQLNRLFTNLLQNAVEACNGKADRKVQMIEELDGDHILIKIIDNGEGIPSSIHQKIFTPNFTTKTSGTGLGLAMSKNIVEQAKGELWFTTKEDQGSTFFVKLPLLRIV